MGATGQRTGELPDQIRGNLGGGVRHVGEILVDEDDKARRIRRQEDNDAAVNKPRISHPVWENPTNQRLVSLVRSSRLGKARKRQAEIWLPCGQQSTAEAGTADEASRLVED